MDEYVDGAGWIIAVVAIALYARGISLDPELGASKERSSSSRTEMKNLGDDIERLKHRATRYKRIGLAMFIVAIIFSSPNTFFR